jgi:hypothetical protein
VHEPPVLGGGWCAALRRAARPPAPLPLDPFAPAAARSAAGTTPSTAAAAP